MLLFRMALPCSSPRRDGFSNHQYPRPFSCLGSNRRYSKWSKFNAQKSVDKSAVLEAVFKRNTKPNAQLRQDLAPELNMTERYVEPSFSPLPSMLMFVAYSIFFWAS